MDYEKRKTEIIHCILQLAELFLELIFCILMSTTSFVWIVYISS